MTKTPTKLLLLMKLHNQKDIIPEENVSFNIYIKQIIALYSCPEHGKYARYP